MKICTEFLSNRLVSYCDIVIANMSSIFRKNVCEIVYRFCCSEKFVRFLEKSMNVCTKFEETNSNSSLNFIPS